MLPKLLLFSLALLFAACTSDCDENQAMNKMLAIGKVQGRLVSKGGESGMSLSARLAMDSAPIGELIAQQKYTEACRKADELEKAYGFDLDREQEDMITIEQLKADGGKGSGTCSLGDAAKKQMEVHALLQAEVDAGRASTDVFRTFGEDTKSLGELMSTNPSKACELMDRLKQKYGLK